MLKDLNVRKVRLVVAVCVMVLLFGLVMMVMLSSQKKAPSVRAIQERVLTVEGMVGNPGDYGLVMTGFGEIRSRDVLSIAPEVTGVVTSVHPRLELGEVILQGSILFEIDARTYRARLTEAQANVDLQADMVKRLRAQLEADGARLATLERTRDLSAQDYRRVYTLFQDSRIGTQAGVDAAEQAKNEAVDRVAQLEKLLTLMPIQIREAESAVAAAEARRDAARLDLARCTVTAPFTGRIRSVRLEPGQLVMPGAELVVLVNDSRREVHLPLDSREARSGLSFEPAPDDRPIDGWFSRVKPVLCELEWTEAGAGYQSRTGRLDRVVGFDRNTRTVTVAVTLEDGGARNALPLVDGMFCRVEIPGGEVTNVYRLPSSAVSFEGTVYTVVSNRLKTVDVEVARVSGDYTYVSAGLWPGVEIITTRLVNPLENSRVQWIREPAMPEPPDS